MTKRERDLQTHTLSCDYTFMAHHIPQSFIDDLLARIDIISVIEPYVTLKKMGTNYKALCPFHQEKTASFSVSQTKQFYHCFGCGASGNAISFLMDHQRMEFLDVIELFANQLGVSLPTEFTEQRAAPSYQPLYDIMEQAANFYQQALRNDKRAIEYLKKRGLTGKIAKQFAIGYAPAGWDHLLQSIGKTKEARQALIQTGMSIKKENDKQYDRFRDRIMFPIRDRRGRIIAFGGRVIGDDTPKYLNSPETAIFHKGSELYGLYEARKSKSNLDRLLLVEGYMDVVALAQHGLNYAVATLGTATSAQHIQQLFRLTPEVVFCFDGDEAGLAAAWRALEILLPLLNDGWSAKFMLLPKGDDPDSMIRKEGLAQFEKRIDKAKTLSEFLFSHLQAQVNMQQLDGRARFVTLAMPYIKKIAAPIMHEMLLDQLTNIARVNLNTLQESTPQKQKTFTQKKSKSKTKISPIRTAITLLLQQPQLVEHLDNELPELELPGIGLLFELIQVIKTNSAVSTGALLEHWRERPEFSHLSQLAAYEHMIPAEGLADEFCATLKHLQAQALEQKIDALMSKATLGTLTDEGKQQLQALLRQRQER